MENQHVQAILAFILAERAKRGKDAGNQSQIQKKDLNCVTQAGWKDNDDCCGCGFFFCENFRRSHSLTGKINLSWVRELLLNSV